MAPTMSSRPRKIEKESGAGAPNLHTGLDHEDNTTNQGSADATAPNLPILGPDDDEDGDNEIPSPSSNLNLDQHENEEDAIDAEHEGDVNEEEERNAEQALVDTLSASQVRRGRGPNKLPSRRFIIMVVNEVGDPTQPHILVNAWKASVGNLVRENVPLTYRFWKGKTHEENTLFQIASNKIYGIP
jgi:hypothetical protein